jgi:hypothetical protein
MESCLSFRTLLIEVVETHTRTQIFKKADTQWRVLKSPLRTVLRDNEARPLALMDEVYPDRSRGRLWWGVFSFLLFCFLNSCDLRGGDILCVLQRNGC